MTPEHREAEGRDEEADLAMCEAASKGPWEYLFSDGCREPHCVMGAPDIDGSSTIVAGTPWTHDQAPKDMTFIAKSRTALPHYILALRTCRKERDELAGRLREVSCVWCGHQFVTTLQSQAEELYQHAKTCEKHPIRKAEAERDELKARFADYRDCMDLAGQIAESIEKADGSWCYEGDDLPGQILPHLQPLIGELDEVRKERDEARSSTQSVIAEFRSQLGDLIRRIGPARRPEDIKAALEAMLNSTNVWGSP